MVRAGIIGATGYAGYELVRILNRHSEAELVFLSSASYAGQRLSQVYPCPWDRVLVAPEDAPVDQVDVVFLCTPHAASAPFARRVLQAGVRCVDLSADFRLRDPEVYAAWYGPHKAPELFDQGVYGLTEIYRQEVAGARLVANPGCYPTGPLLALAPLAKASALADGKMIIDAKSGVSGAGATPTPKTHYVAVHDNLSAYNVGRRHRHLPEIEQELAAYGAPTPQVVFTPHLLPVSRGILTSVYVHVAPGWDAEQVIALWGDAYGNELFVHVLEQGGMATLAHAVNTNRCALSVSPSGIDGELIIFTAIDNLLKGASGQAVQNMNAMFGLDETDGLLD